MSLVKLSPAASQAVKSLLSERGIQAPVRIDPETQQLVGEVSIACKEDEGRDVFLLTSSKPVSEWDGLLTCSLRM
jgi:hypothetical protein